MAGKGSIVDVAALVKPISALMPSGESLRRSTVYDQIKEARREEDASLSQGVWKTDVKRADWDRAAQLCIEALQSRSKDLRIAAWLTEAWLALHGVRGAEQGLRVIEGLCARFWDTLHPPIEDGDLEGRLAPLAWVNEKLAGQLKLIPMTRPATKEPEIYSWMDWERASVMERSGQRNAAAEGDVSTAQFMTCVLLTPAAYYVELLRDLGDLAEAVDAVDKVVDKRCGRPMASLWQFKEVLASIRDFVSKALDQKAEEEPDAQPESVGPSSGPVATSHSTSDDEVGRAGVRWGPIRNRAEAYQRLSEAADYLLTKEPHSPTPHLVKRAVSWGNMSFTELISELVQDRNDLYSIYGLLGIPPPEDR